MGIVGLGPIALGLIALVYLLTFWTISLIVRLFKLTNLSLLIIVSPIISTLLSNSILTSADLLSGILLNVPLSHNSFQSMPLFWFEINCEYISIKYNSKSSFYIVYNSCKSKSVVLLLLDQMLNQY